MTKPRFVGEERYRGPDGSDGALWFLDARVAVPDANGRTFCRATLLARRAMGRGRGMDAAGYDGYAGER